MIKIGNTTIGNVTIKDGSNSFITENTARKEAFLTPMPLFGNDSSGTDVFDFGGTLKTITLIGSYDDGTVAGARTYINNVEGLIQGNQASAYTFLDDLRSPISALKVKVESFESTLVEGQFKLTWTLRLVESSLNG